MEIVVLILSIIGTLLSLGGNVLIALKKRSGWLVWIAGNIVWIAVIFMSAVNYPMIFMYLVYIIINIIGYVKWQK